MDAIQMAMQDIYFRIPYEVLNATFNPLQSGLSLDECIRQKLILGKVIYDINLSGGAKTSIILKYENAVNCLPPVPYSMMLGSFSVYRIPPEDREHRNIVSVLDVRHPYSFNAYQANPSQFSNGMMGATLDGLASAALNAQTFANVATTPTPVLLQGDLVRLDPPQMSHIDWVLECRLEWDKNFTSMDPTTIGAFVDLVYTAIRGYIYTNLIFQASRVFLSGGQELNVMKEFIEEGKSFLDIYPEKVKEFCGATLLARNEVGKMIAYML